MIQAVSTTYSLKIHYTFQTDQNASSLHSIGLAPQHLGAAPLMALAVFNIIIECASLRQSGSVQTQRMERLSKQRPIPHSQVRDSGMSSIHGWHRAAFLQHYGAIEHAICYTANIITTNLSQLLRGI